MTHEKDDKKHTDFSVSGADRAIAEAMASVEHRERGEDEETVEVDVEGGAPSGQAKHDALASLLQQKDDRLKESHERLQRMAADFENYKKRTKRELEEEANRAREKVLSEVLPVLDSFERTLEHIRSGADAAAMSEGIALVHRQLLQGLTKVGIEAIESLGKPFDPRFHEALSQEMTSEMPPQHVLREHQKGYLLGGKLLRPSRVVVSQGKDPGPEKAPGDVTPIKC